MKNRSRSLFFAAAACLLTLQVRAQDPVSLSATRTSGANIEQLEKFYCAAFGLQQTGRQTLPSGKTEIALNFGASVAAAKANPATQILLLQRDSDALKDPAEVHMLFSVTDIRATAAAVVKAGGRMAGEPRTFGRLTVGVAIDPAGNHIELVQGFSR